MRNAIKVIIFLCALISLPANAHALSDKDFELTDDPFKAGSTFALVSQADAEAQEAKDKTETQEAEKPEEAPKQEPAKPLPVQHTVASGENLTKIAEKHATTWKRLFDKNIQLADPNLLGAGQVLTIPTAEEVLIERPLPAAPVAAPASNTVGTRSSVRASGYTGSSAGNTYTPGYCTWYAKNRRPDLPNRLGNASAWVGAAAARGLATGSTPRVGAIGQQGNHVVYVESVNADGTVTVSEMNYRGLFVVSSRTVSAGTFRYIY